MSPERSCSVQLMPGGRSASNSKTHSRSLVQRPLPLVAWGLLQLSARGAGALGSPKLTALSSNLTTTRRACATSPWGDRLVICSACACRLRAASKVVAIFILCVVTVIRLPFKESSSRVRGSDCSIKASQGRSSCNLGRPWTQCTCFEKMCTPISLNLIFLQPIYGF